MRMMPVGRVFTTIAGIFCRVEGKAMIMGIYDAAFNYETK